MKQDKHWDYIQEGIEQLFNEEYAFIREHTLRCFNEGLVETPQSDLKSLEITKENLIYAVETLFEHKQNIFCSQAEYYY